MRLHESLPVFRNRRITTLPETIIRRQCACRNYELLSLFSTLWRNYLPLYICLAFTECLGKFQILWNLWCCGVSSSYGCRVDVHAVNSHFVNSTVAKHSSYRLYIDVVSRHARTVDSLILLRESCFWRCRTCFTLALLDALPLHRAHCVLGDFVGWNASSVFGPGNIRLQRKCFRIAWNVKRILEFFNCFVLCAKKERKKRKRKGSVVFEAKNIFHFPRDTYKKKKGKKYNFLNKFPTNANTLQHKVSRDIPDIQVKRNGSREIFRQTVRQIFGSPARSIQINTGETFLILCLVETREC